MSGDKSVLREPKLITSDQISKDLQEAGNTDPLASEDVKILLAELKPLYSGGKWEIMKSESFEKTEKILRVKEDLLAIRKTLLQKYDDLNIQVNELKKIASFVDD